MKAINSLSRREVLGAGALAGAGVIASGVPLRAAAQPRAVPKTPEEALGRLMAGNDRFVNGETAELGRSMTRVRELSSGQSPFAAILGCADSRVPVELLFDEGFGDLFTVRVAGNVASPEEIASLEYAVAVLGSQVVMVLGHTSCGAVTAAVEGAEVPGQISTLYQHIAPNVPLGTSVDDAIRANARHHATVLSTASPVMRDALATGKIQIQAAVYSLEDGRVELL